MSLKVPELVMKARSVDFHWIARDASVFSWFATLLNTATREKPGVKVNTYLTSKQNSITAYIFSVLIDRNELPTTRMVGSECKYVLSSLTGLRNKTTFGRPDFADIRSEMGPLSLLSSQGRSASSSVVQSMWAWKSAIDARK